MKNNEKKINCIITASLLQNFTIEEIKNFWHLHQQLLQQQQQLSHLVISKQFSVNAGIDSMTCCCLKAFTFLHQGLNTKNKFDSIGFKGLEFVLREMGQANKKNPQPVLKAFYHLDISEELHFENISMEVLFAGRSVKFDFSRTEPFFLPTDRDLAEAIVILLFTAGWLRTNRRRRP